MPPLWRSASYRAITRAAARKLELDAADFTIKYQMTMRALKSGLKIAEMPTTEHPRVARENHARSTLTGVRFTKAFWRELRRGKAA